MSQCNKIVIVCQPFIYLRSSRRVEFFTVLNSFIVYFIMLYVFCLEVHVQVYTPCRTYFVCSCIFNFNCCYLMLYRKINHQYLKKWLRIGVIISNDVIFKLQYLFSITKFINIHLLWKTRGYANLLHFTILPQS